MKQQLQDMVNTQISLTDLSVEAFIIEKVRVRYSEIAELKDQYLKLTGNPFPSEEDGEPVSSNGYAYPSKKEMILTIDKFLEENKDAPFKTRDIFNRYYPDTTEKLVREELVRRYSSILNDRKQKGKLYNKKIEGERGDTYCTSKEKLDSL
jgi:hypothetical protein